MTNTWWLSLAFTSPQERLAPRLNLALEGFHSIESPPPWLPCTANKKSPYFSFFQKHCMFSFLPFLDIYLCVHATCAPACVWRSEDNLEVLVLLFRHAGLQVSNSDGQAWLQALLPTKPYHRSGTQVFFISERQFKNYSSQVKSWYQNTDWLQRLPSSPGHD